MTFLLCDSFLFQCGAHGEVKARANESWITAGL